MLRGGRFLVKVGDRVRHRAKGTIGSAYEIKGNRVLVDWSDETGVMFRWARKENLEVISRGE